MNITDKNMKETKVASNFWKNKNEYPDYPFVKERRKYELDFLLENINPSAKSLFDMGCGDGSTVILLRELSNIKRFYCHDISDNLMSGDWGERNSEVIKKSVDFNDPLIDLPEADVTICMNMFPYIFDDSILRGILVKIKSDLFLSRVTCEKNGRLIINKYSEDLGDYIASVYRTKEEYKSLYEEHFSEVVFFRSFPDEIESKYGTNQYFFICKK
jgi:hypothetical protein